jgi:RNA polymerase sigma-70 factor (ECF subfamily)
MNESKIIRRCQNRDLNAFKMIYDRYNQPLLHTAQRVLGQREDAEDAVQTTFIKLYRSIDNFQFKSKFSTYLFRILMNVCFDMRKKIKALKTESLEDIYPSRSSDQDKKIYLDKCIKALPEQMRSCFVLYAEEQFKYKDIARIMDISIGSVKSNIFHAKMKLRAMLSPGQEEAKA